MKKVLTIGIDCRDLLKASTGTRTYLSELTEQFKQTPSSSIRFIYFHDPLPVLLGKSYMHKFCEHMLFFIWKQIVLPVKAFSKGCDILFCTDYFLPLVRLRYKTVVVFHDAFFWEYPTHYNKIWLRLFHLLAVPSAKKSARILVPSAHSKGTIAARLKLPLKHFTVVYEAGKRLPETGGIKQGFILEELRGQTYFLHVGGFNKHKNLVRLVEAFRILKLQHPQKSIHLVLAGTAGSSIFSDESIAIKKTIKQYDLSHCVHLPGYVSDQELSTLYQHALAYIFPSYNEGFGLPALEAMAFKLPVIAANNTCLPEICKEGAIYFDPFDIDKMAFEMNRILVDDSLRKRIIENQQDVMSKYSWENTANEIIQIFEEINYS